MRFVLLFFLTLSYLVAHNLHHTVSYEESITITLSFAQEGDFSFQSYEVYAPRKETPFQVGRTDAHARVVFVPDTSGKWRVKLFSEDGHGKIIEIDIDKSVKKQEVAENDSLFVRSILGLLFLLATFGAIYFIKKEKK